MKHTLISKLTVLGFLGAGMLSQAALIEISLESTGPMALAPSWAQFSSTPDPVVQGGATASAGLELLAELGDPSLLIGERGGQTLFGPTLAGAVNTTVVPVANTDNYFNFAAMILPSNDWFVGTGGQVPVVDITPLLNGGFGDSLTITFFDIYDAGTEQEDFNTAAPPGAFGFADPALSAPPAGDPDDISTIHLVDTSGNPFEDLANPFADVSSLAINGGAVATVTLTYVPEPTSGVLVGLAGLALIGRRQRK